MSYPYGWMVCALLVALPAAACQAAIFRWDNGQLIPGTEGMTPGPGVNLDGWHLEFADLINEDLTDAQFTGANLANSHFGNAVLTSASLRNANLTGANLTNANLGGATLTNADLSGALVADVLFGDTPNLTREQLYSTASYQAKDLHGIALWSRDLTGWNLSGQNLRGALLSGCNLANVNLSGANLSNAGLIASTLTNTDLTGAVVAGTNFFFARGLTKEQLYSTASYQVQDLGPIVLGAFCGPYGCEPGYPDTGWETGWNLRAQNLRDATLYLEDIDLTGADVRGARVSNLIQSITRNTILPDGRIVGLDLKSGERMLIRDDDGFDVPDSGYLPRPPVHVKIQDRLNLADGSVLQLRFDANAWNSLISFQPGIPIQLGGTLELKFGSDVDPASQIGRTLRIFDWAGVSPSGQFQVNSPYVWDTTNLYTTGEVTLVAVPEPPASLMLLIGGFRVGIRFTFVCSKRFQHTGG